MCMFYSVYSQLALSHVPKWFACVDSGEVELYQFYNCNPCKDYVLQNCMAK